MMRGSSPRLVTIGTTLVLCAVPLRPLQPPGAQHSIKRSGTLTPGILAPIVALGDVDGDGTPDRIYLEAGGRETGPGSRQATVRFELSRGAAHEAVPVPADSLTIAALDLDNDDDLDLLIVSRSGRLTVLVNEGNGRFWPKELPVPNRVTPVASFDTVVAAAVSTPHVPLGTDGDTSGFLSVRAAREHLLTDVCRFHGPPPSAHRLRGPPNSRG